MSQHRLLKSWIISGCFLSGTMACELPCTGQEVGSLLLIQDPLRLQDQSNAITPPLKLTQEVPMAQNLTRSAPTSNAKVDARREVETIRERFKDGRIHVVREVTLDDEGNYINHGTYEEWSAAGEILSAGSYELGERQGPWVKILSAKEAKLFSTQPYAQFKAPFQSCAEFQKGQLHGLWVITDADHKTVSHIQLVAGVRDGQASWFHPNGQVYFQAEYQGGLLNGALVEKDVDGKVVRNDILNDGQRIEPAKEFYPSKVVKSETTYLSAPQQVISKDDWVQSTLANYGASGDRIKHGSFTEFHENGQVKTQGTYDHGVLIGKLESWHPTGERSISGSFQQGERHGKWSWWHANGMRKSVVQFDRGQVAGEILAWSEQGKRLTSPQDIEEAPQTAQQRPASAR